MKNILISAVALCLASCSGPDGTVIVESNSDCPYNVTRHDPNGWLLTEPEVHLDFWGDWSNYPQVVQPYTYENDWYNLLNYDDILQRLAEYGIHEGTVDSTYYTNTGATATADDGGPDDAGVLMLEDSTFAAILNEEIRLELLPYPNDNTLYVVMLPPNAFSVRMLAQHWSGYHDHANYGSQQYAYAIISDNGNLVTTSHEIYEAATNPDGNGWWDQASGNEVGDLCNGYTENIYGFLIQKVWSQSLCTCQ